MDYAAFTPWMVYKALSTLKTTASGIDEIPYWFFKGAAPFLAEPLSYLYSLSLEEMHVPTQWKIAKIRPIPKVNKPENCSDFRPISLTPILSRLLEKLIVRQYFYPLLVQPTLFPLLHDQTAFRPTGSTTAALISLLHPVSKLLTDNQYVHVIALDFSKAFDSISHAPLLQKLSNYQLPDQAYNWTRNFLTERAHVTSHNDQLSTTATITASVIQGSALGPVAYIINSSDLRPLHAENLLLKYADDTYLIVPASNTHTINSEIDNVHSWANKNNLKLNLLKTKEIVITRPRSTVALPTPLPNLPRVTSMNILGVTLSSKLKFDEHVNSVVSSCHQHMYALKILKAKGLTGRALNQVSNAYLVNRITYALPAWWGFTTSAERTKLQSVLNKASRWGLDGGIVFPTIELTAEAMQRKLFANILANQTHVLHHLLPP